MDDEKIIYHCNLIESIFGLIHNACNLSVTKESFLLVFFHNLSRYDAHHIVKYLKLKEHYPEMRKRSIFFESSSDT